MHKEVYNRDIQKATGKISRGIFNAFGKKGKLRYHDSDEDIDCIYGNDGNRTDA